MGWCAKKRAYKSLFSGRRGALYGGRSAPLHRLSPAPLPQLGARQVPGRAGLCVDALVALLKVGPGFVAVVVFVPRCTGVHQLLLAARQAVELHDLLSGAGGPADLPAGHAGLGRLFWLGHGPRLHCSCRLAPQIPPHQLCETAKQKKGGGHHWPIRHLAF